MPACNIIVPVFFLINLEIVSLFPRKMKTFALFMSMVVFVFLNPVDAWWVRAINGKLCLSPCVYARDGDFYLDDVLIENGKTFNASCATDFIYNTTQRNTIYK